MTSGMPPDVSRLSIREVERELAEARRARIATIDRYWMLCRTDPARAERAGDGAAAVVRDLFHLALNSFPVPRPSVLDGLSEAIDQLLRIEAIRSVVLANWGRASPAELANAFWEDERIIAVKTVGRTRAVVVRCDGPLLNPGTLPDGDVAYGHDWRVVCHTTGDGNGNDYQFLAAYVIGSMDGYARWGPAQLDLEARSDLWRDLAAMETLVESERLGEDYPDTHPLPTFVTDSDRLIAQLQGRQAVLRQKGSITAARQAIVDRRTRPLYERAARLRRGMKRMEDELDQIRRDIAHVEACALEEETGFARGDRVRHRFTGDEGTLEIVNFGTAAQFRLFGTSRYVTEDIRLGEWEKLDVAPEPGLPARGLAP